MKTLYESEFEPKKPDPPQVTGNSKQFLNNFNKIMKTLYKTAPKSKKYATRYKDDPGLLVSDIYNTIEKYQKELKKNKQESLLFEHYLKLNYSILTEREERTIFRPAPEFAKKYPELTMQHQRANGENIIVKDYDKIKQAISRGSITAKKAGVENDEEFKKLKGITPQQGIEKSEIEKKKESPQEKKKKEKGFIRKAVSKANKLWTKALDPVASHFRDTWGGTHLLPQMDTEEEMYNFSMVAAKAVTAIAAIPAIALIGSGSIAWTLAYLAGLGRVYADFLDTPLPDNYPGTS